jgi:hypothetical protein
MTPKRRLGSARARHGGVKSPLSLLREAAAGEPVNEPPLAVTAVDLGRAVSAAALSAWGEVEARAELLLQIDCVGPVRADEQRLSRLLYQLIRHLLAGLPPGRSPDRVLRMRSRCHGPSRARVEVRVMGREVHSSPSLPAFIERAPDPQLEEWGREAERFGARLLADAGPGQLSALQLELELIEER